MSEARTWRTCDLKNVAVLLHFGHKLVRHGKENGRAFFDFEESDFRKKMILDFWNKELSVDPMSFLDSLNRARDLVSLALNS